jgi:hypothetical protein
LVEQEEAWNIKFQSTPKSTKEEDELFDDMLLKVQERLKLCISRVNAE